MYFGEKNLSCYSILSGQKENNDGDVSFYQPPTSPVVGQKGQNSIEKGNNTRDKGKSALCMWSQ